MTFKEKIRNRFNELMKTKSCNETEKSILRLVLGEISTIEARGVEKISDAEVTRIIKKIIQSNEQTLVYLEKDSDRYQTLLVENNILATLLPKVLTFNEVKDIIDQIPELVKHILVAKTDGAAIGHCCKFFKETNKNVSGEDVAKIIKSMRETT